MESVMVSDAEFAAMLETVAACRARADKLHDRTAVDAAVRARLIRPTDPPEPQTEQDYLVIEIVKLLESPRLLPWQAHDLVCAFFSPSRGRGHAASSTWSLTQAEQFWPDGSPRLLPPEART